MKIKTRIALATGACLALSSVILLAAFAWENSEVENKTQSLVVTELTNKALAQLSASAAAEAGKTQIELSQALSIAKGMADTSVSFITEQSTETSRQRFYEYTRDVLSRNKDTVMGAYIAWEKNAVNDDALHNDAHHSHKNGQFAPYWFLNGDGSLGSRPLDMSTVEEAAATGGTDGDWYLCPIKNRGACMVEPYSWVAGGKTIVGTSITVPLIV